MKFSDYSRNLHKNDDSAAALTVYLKYPNIEVIFLYEFFTLPIVVHEFSHVVDKQYTIHEIEDRTEFRAYFMEFLVKKFLTKAKKHVII